MITREQVADLQPGDVVELRDERWPDVVTRGSVHESLGYLWLGDVVVKDKDPSRQFAPHTATLTVVSRAPRPLYVNHPRTEPVPGDIVIPVDHDPDDVVTWSWCPLRTGVYRWRSTLDDSWLDRTDLDVDLRLLVDGKTGQTVP